MSRIRKWNKLTVSGVSLTPSNSRPGLVHLQKQLPSPSLLPPIGVRGIAMSMSVCLYVCLSVRTYVRQLAYLKNQASELHNKFSYTFPVAVARSSSGNAAIRNVLPLCGWRLSDAKLAYARLLARVQHWWRSLMSASAQFTARNSCSESTSINMHKSKSGSLGYIGSIHHSPQRKAQPVGPTTVWSTKYTVSQKKTSTIYFFG